ncbi:hypothetical protein MKW94_007315 [Papaver nudicaule]|uniref:Uncharacterized protein n=1 Tax=Papaver nudicaule TaxID=74823 RepID=A0AA41VXE5_PAPNU|nr:hypothetical protein [Papaver nudicaule]
MASGKVTYIAFLVMFIVVCSDISSIVNAQAIKCCHDNAIGSCLTGSASDNERCNNLCGNCPQRKGGKCKLVDGGRHVCHCLC